MATIVGAIALFSLGAGATFLGIYVSAQGVSAQQLPFSVFLVGFKESLTAVIVSACFVTLNLLLHFTTRRVLGLWRAPLNG